jgi:hypothetical protein
MGQAYRMDLLISFGNCIFRLRFNYYGGDLASTGMRKLKTAYRGLRAHAKTR